MPESGGALARWAVMSLVALGTIPAAASAPDLSKYRDFQLGTSLLAVAKQVGVNVSQATVLHRRPALIQELEWSPRPLGLSARTESAQDVVFGFYDGELFRIAVKYDRYETEGLTAGDFIEALSATYGIAEKPAPPANAVPGAFGEQDEIVARWQDSQYRFDLIRTSYGPSFRLIGLLKKLQGPSEAAFTEATRLDDLEAPQRDAARIADEREAQRVKLEEARLLNKPKFRP